MDSVGPAADPDRPNPPTGATVVLREPWKEALKIPHEGILARIGKGPFRVKYGGGTGTVVVEDADGNTAEYGGPWFVMVDECLKLSTFPLKHR